MTAPAAGNDRTVLLILPDKREMFPLSTAAFTQAQASRRKLNADYGNALVLDTNGELKKVERVEVIGPWGESIGRKLWSQLTGAWRIQTELSDPLPYSLDEVKRLVADCSVSPGAADSPWLNGVGVEKVLASVHAASSIGELLEGLNLPAPEDALDVL